MVQSNVQSRCAHEIQLYKWQVVAWPHSNQSLGNLVSRWCKALAAHFWGINSNCNISLLDIGYMYIYTHIMYIYIIYIYTYVYVYVVILYLLIHLSICL